MERKALVARLRHLSRTEAAGRDGVEGTVERKRRGVEVEESSMHKNPFEEHRTEEEAAGETRKGGKRRLHVKALFYGKTAEFQVRSNSTIKDVLHIALHVIFKDFIASIRTPSTDTDLPPSIKGSLMSIIKGKTKRDVFDIFVPEEEETVLDTNCNVQSFQEKVFEIRKRDERKKITVIDMEGGRREVTDLPEDMTIGELRSKAKIDVSYKIRSVGLREGKELADDLSIRSLGRLFIEKNIRREDFMVPSNLEKEYAVFQHVLFLARIERVLRIDSYRIELVEKREKLPSVLLKVDLKDIEEVSVSNSKVTLKYKKGRSSRTAAVNFKIKEEAEEFGRYSSLLSGAEPRKSSGAETRRGGKGQYGQSLEERR